MDKIGSDISSSEDELLTGEKIENNYSPIERLGDKMETSSVKDDDRMSLSSLSSTEQKIEERKLDGDLAQMQHLSTTQFQAYHQYPGMLNFFVIVTGFVGV